jgi:hypothetical protein
MEKGSKGGVMKTAQLLVFLILLIPHAVPAITKCVTPSGDIVFTDTDCPAGSSKGGES